MARLAAFEYVLLEPEPLTLLHEFLQEHIHDSKFGLSSVQLYIPTLPSEKEKEQFNNSVSPVNTKH